jgi:PilZ domain
MDPNIHFEQPGLAGGRGPAEDSAAYLRRLKAELTEDAAHGGAEADTQSLATQSAPPIKERRQSQRFACSGSVEFKAEGSDVHMWGTVTDISLHGCYVEMSTTFPINTKASLVIESGGIRFHTQATVRLPTLFLEWECVSRESKPDKGNGWKRFWRPWPAKRPSSMAFGPRNPTSRRLWHLRIPGPAWTRSPSSSRQMPLFRATSSVRSPNGFAAPEISHRSKEMRPVWRAPAG